MNKFTKGAIAGAAGIALLLGGAGSLAYWNDEATADAGTVSTGHLEFASNGDGAWNQDIDYIVPGDTVEYTETFDLDALGDNLAVELEAEIPSLAAYSSVDVDTTFALSGDDTATITPGTPYQIAEGSYTVTVTVTVTFPFGTSANNVDEDLTIDLDGITVTATQV